MRRFGTVAAVLVAALAGTTLLAPGTSLGRDGSATRGATPSSQSSSLKLERVVIDRTGIILPEAWSVPKGGGSAQFNPPFGQATYRFPVPKQIPAGGARVTLSVSVTAAPTSRFAPALGILGDVDIKGQAPFQVGALAEPGQSASASKTLELVPRTYAGGALVRVIVGLQDGPRITYEYRASAAPSSAARARAALDWARGQLGSRAWVGRCQRFVQAAYKASTGYRNANEAAAKLGVRRGPVTEAPVGALVYFKTVQGVTAKDGHVGLYIGGGKMISALGTVKISDVTAPPWSRAHIGWAAVPAGWPGRR